MSLQLLNFELPRLLGDIGVWAEETFPDEKVEGKLRHLKEEVEELLDAPSDRSEWADCFLLLFDAARKQGLTFNEIVNSINDKWEKNKTRSFVQDSPGMYHHTKEATC